MGRYAIGRKVILKEYMKNKSNLACFLLALRIRVEKKILSFPTSLKLWPEHNENKSTDTGFTENLDPRFVKTGTG